MSLMSQEVPASVTEDESRSPWASIAFMVESILLLVFLAASLAVLTSVFSSSLSGSVESRTRDAAVIAASTVAERFAADPAGLEPETKLGDLRVASSVTSERRTGGTMYRADIAVYDASRAGGEEPVYTLSTSSYRSAGEGSFDSAASGRSAQDDGNEVS